MQSEFGVLTIGDAMITMNPMSTGPLRYVTNFERKVGGAEMNFAIGCSRLGMHSKWISRLGKDEFGRVIYNFARGEGVDVSAVDFVEDVATSVNFKEIQGNGNGKTFYYRDPSPVTSLKEEDITEELFEGIQAVHLTGVYLAVNHQHLSIAKKIIKIAKEKQLTISFDPNIRLKLWSAEKAKEVIETILPDVDIILTGLDELQLISGKESLDELKAYTEGFGIQDLVIKDGSRGSKLCRNGEWTSDSGFTVTPIDSVGAGDGFDAAYLYGYLNHYETQQLLRFANAVGALVTTVSGDNEGLPYLEDVLAFIDNKKMIER
ncbi:sugar kinase [Jeotgalibacillus proteolyticus]|uniref:2-keto-3-deoxygluconate kinase n=1 Tax=Jeotgalibacillus proteolyticus TaxID=2082395 RepID=A0A2S5G821_9BACL|nr:sugar kinase [Jeotgalibacillus proteolyticus]PPA69136.1 2-keto-3-deoxygluconate kinase [Jeotgalibacillus proteolyticus]